MPRTLLVLSESLDSHWRLAEPFRCLYEAGYPASVCPDDEFTTDAATKYDMVVLDGALPMGELLGMARALRDAKATVTVAFSHDPIDSSWAQRDCTARGFTSDLCGMLHGVLVDSFALGVSLAPYLDRVPEMFPTYIDPRIWSPREIGQAAPIVTALCLDENAEQFQFLQTLQGCGLAIDIVTAVDLYNTNDLIRRVQASDIGLCAYQRNYTDDATFLPVDALLFGAARVPVVATSAYAGIVGRRGIILGRDPASWCAAVGSLQANEQRRYALAQSLHSHVTTRWNLATHTDSVAHALRTVYRRVIAGMKKVDAA